MQNPPLLAWTLEYPADEGWYWFKEMGQPVICYISFMAFSAEEPIVVELGATFMDEPPMPLHEVLGEWAGPLQPPLGSSLS